MKIKVQVMKSQSSMTNVGEAQLALDPIIKAKARTKASMSPAMDSAFRKVFGVPVDSYDTATYESNVRAEGVCVIDEDSEEAHYLLVRTSPAVRSLFGGDAKKQYIVYTDTQAGGGPFTGMPLYEKRPRAFYHWEDAKKAYAKLIA